MANEKFLPMARRRLAELLVLVSLLASPSCADASEAHLAGERVAALRILFVGNSLTYANDLPAMLTALAEESGIAVTTETYAFPDFSLEDHLRDRRALAAVARGRWDFVVLQQGPSALEDSRRQLLRDSRKLARAIAGRGARPALYMVWPSRSRVQDFERSAESYRLAAAAIDGRLAAVGDAWRAAWRRDPSLRLHGADGLHPTAAGSYLAALTLHRVLVGPLPVSAATPAGAQRIAGAALQLSEAQLRILVEASSAGSVATEGNR